MQGYQVFFFATACTTRVQAGNINSAKMDMHIKRNDHLYSQPEPKTVPTHSRQIVVQATFASGTAVPSAVCIPMVLLCDLQFAVQEIQYRRVQSRTPRQNHHYIVRAKVA